MNHSSDAMEPARRPIIQYETKANMQGGTTRNGNKSNSTCCVHNVVRTIPHTERSEMVINPTNPEHDTRHTPLEHSATQNSNTSRQGPY